MDPARIVHFIFAIQYPNIMHGTRNPGLELVNPRQYMQLLLHL